jgi:formylglycine-generating enzyme required for sulfatase activity
MYHLLFPAATLLLSLAHPGQEHETYPDMPRGPRPVHEVEGASAGSEQEMRAYVDSILGSAVSFRMQPIAGGEFSMGSPAAEAQRKADEGPVRRVAIAPFWMGACEVTWDEYELFMLRKDKPSGEQAAQPEGAAQDAWADAVTRPTPPYVPMDFNMGVKGFPAISMTQFAAKQYTKWLSMKTGRFYRLPTEAEWEYACRAGSASTFAFGDSAEELYVYAWFYGNSDDAYHPVGSKKPNAFGLFDMHGNVAEWVLDGYGPESYAMDNPIKDAPQWANPVNWPKKEYPRVVRGGSWDDDAEGLRSAARRGSSPSWKMMDPQLPKSIWYLTNAQTVGFRLVRPLTVPSLEEQERYWAPDSKMLSRLIKRQRAGKR